MRYRQFLLPVLLVSFLISCAGGAGGGSLSDVDGMDEGFNDSIVQALNYSGVSSISTDSVDVHEVSGSTLCWTDNIGAGKQVYLVRTNCSSGVLSSSEVRTVLSASGIAGKNSNGFGTSSPSVSVNLGRSGVPCQVPGALKGKRSIARDAAVNDLYSRTKKWYVGDQRELWLDDGKGNFQKKTVKLYAKNEYCYVWCVPDEATSFSKLSGLASVFDEICLPVIYLSGLPSSDIFGKVSNGVLGKISMNGFSPTGDMVNLVVYDIGSDGSSGSYIGFFASRDYYPDKEDLSIISGLNYRDSDVNLNYSNEGQFLYLDSWYLRNRYGVALSTMVHEFHHLIVWGQKFMNYGNYIDDAWNELLSLMCEDLMQAKIAQEEPSYKFWDSPAQRLPYFNKNYVNAGLELRSDLGSAGTVFSYSTIYAFGAWLLRNFGGAELFARMARSKYVNESMVIEAVNSVNGTSYTMENLLGMFAVSCVAPKYFYTMNKSSATTRNYNGYSFPSPPIDLWHFRRSDFTGLNDSYTSYDGCGLLAPEKSCSLRPYGMVLSYVGKSTGENIAITFSNNVTSKQKCYVVITD